MHFFKKSPLILTGIIALLSALSFASPAKAQGPGGNDTQKTPNVTVVNRPTNPVPVRNVDGPTRQPVSAEVELTVLSGFDETAGVIYAVPAGKLLVIEYLSARAKLPHDQGIAEIGCTTRLFGVPPVSTYFEATHMSGSSSQEFFVTSKLVSLYAAPETHVSVFLKRLPQTTGTGQVLFTLHGYLVDAP
jgi:hypothetical protein